LFVCQIVRVTNNLISVQIPLRHGSAKGRDLDGMAVAQKTPDTGKAKARGGAEDGPLDFGRIDTLLGYHLRRAQVLMFQDFAEAMAETGISPGQIGVLLLVATNPGVNQTTVGNALGIDRSTLVSMLDRLEERKVVARTPSPRDRRSHALVLTAKGQEFLASLLPRLDKHEQRIAARLSASERATLVALLRRISGP
jgi:DNA-binding MarR family transcriptional regulator